MTKQQLDHSRHLAKTVTWRIIGTIDTMILAWIITGDPSMGLKIGGVEVFTKMILYYLHERVWYNMSFGKKIKNKVNPDETTLNNHI